MKRVYLDNAATTPLDPEVLEAMMPLLTEHFGNPSSTHTHGRKVKGFVENARVSIAKAMKVQPGEIYFTSGGTEADNMAIRGSVKHLGVKHIITSPIEHHAVLHTAEELHHCGQAEMHLVNLLPDGHVDFAHLEELLRSHSNVLVSLMHGNNEIGNLLDLKRTGDLCKQYNALFHTDAVQTMGHYVIEPEAYGIDFLACSAHKFNGPKGVGFLYCSKRNKISSMITGGLQESNMRGGTENTYGIAGLGKAFEICMRDMEKKQAHIRALKAHMIKRLKEEIPGVLFNGDSAGDSLYTVLSVSLPPTETGSMLLFNLDLEGVSASGGSACSSGSNKGSHVLGALGVDEKRSNVRFSFGKFNTLEDIDHAVEVLRQFYPAAVSA